VSTAPENGRGWQAVIGDGETTGNTPWRGAQ